MRIGLDYWPATTHAPGVGRYARELTRALAGLPQLGPTEGHGLSLLEFGLGAQTVGELGLDPTQVSVRRRRVLLPRRLMGATWIPAADTLCGSVDLFHHIVPGLARVRRAAQCITLSEIPAEGSAAAARLTQALQPMDAVFVFCEAAAQEAAASLGVPTERLRVVPVGCDHWSREPAPHDERESTSGSEEAPVLLVLGTPQARRQPERILDAFRVLRERGVSCRLRFVGGAEPTPGPVSQAVATREDVCHDLPHERDLPAVVRSSSALVHLHLAEATAVTPLEAFSFGLPVVASDLPAFREALGGEALLTPQAAPSAGDGSGRAASSGSEAFADLLEQALASSRDEQACDRRRKLAAGYSWERSAEATWAAWGSLI